MAEFKIKDKETGEIFTVREKDGQSTQQEQVQPIQENYTEQPQSNNLLQSLIIGGVGAGAYSAYKGGLIPSIQKRYQEDIAKNKLLDTLTNMQKELGIEGTQFERIGSKIGEVEKVNKMQFEQQNRKLEYESNLALKNSKSALEDFDNKILNSNVENTVESLREAHPILKQNFSKGYEAGKTAIENYLNEKGVKFNSLDFTKLLDNVQQRLTNEGALPEELMPVLQMKQQLAPQFENSMLAEEKPIAFNQMRGYVSSITKNNSKSKLAPILNEEWLNFLDEKLPSDVSPIVKEGLQKLKVNYREFANADRQLNSILGKVGEFNNDKANAYVLKYIKSNIDNGAKDLLDFVSKGNEIGEGVPKITEQLNAIMDLKNKRGELVNQIPQIKQIQQEAIQKNADEFMQKSQKLIQWKSKYNDLMSKIAKDQEKGFMSAAKNIYRGLKVVSKIGSRAGMMASSYMQFKDIIKFTQDPEAYLYSLETGGQEELAPKGTQERDIQTGRII